MKGKVRGRKAMTKNKITSTQLTRLLGVTRPFITKPGIKKILKPCGTRPVAGGFPVKLYDYRTALVAALAKILSEAGRAPVTQTMEVADRASKLKFWKSAVDFPEPRDDKREWVIIVYADGEPWMQRWENVGNAVLKEGSAGSFVVRFNDVVKRVEEVLKGSHGDGKHRNRE